MSDEQQTQPNAAKTASKTDRIESLKRKQEQIKAQIAALEAREKNQQRKEDTRLKIIIGAAFMADSKLHPETASLLVDVLSRAITTERDRAFLAQKGWLAAPSVPAPPMDE